MIGILLNVIITIYKLEQTESCKTKLQISFDVIVIHWCIYITYITFILWWKMEVLINAGKYYNNISTIDNIVKKVLKYLFSLLNAIIWQLFLGISKKPMKILLLLPPLYKTVIYYHWFNNEQFYYYILYIILWSSP